MSRKLLNRFRCSNQSSGPKSQILLRAKLARFLGRALLAAAEPWARRGPAAGLVAHFHFLSVLAGGHGSVPRARLFFLALIRAAGQCFSCSGNQKGGGRSFSLGRLSEHFRHRNALGFAWRRTSKSRRYVARAESSCEFLRARGQETTPAEQRFMKHP